MPPGLIAGNVVAGFGLASVYIVPLSQYLLGAYGLQQSMLYLGIGFVAVTCFFGMFLSLILQMDISQVLVPLALQPMSLLTKTSPPRRSEVPVFEGALEEEEGLVLSKVTND